MSKILLVIDMQSEFSKGCPNEYNSIIKYILDNGSQYDRIMATMFKNCDNSPYERYLDWSEMKEIAGLEFKADNVIIKNGYGISDYSIFNKHDEITVIGMDTDACIMKVALDLFDRGLNFRVLLDYCYSSGGKEINAYAAKILRRNIGKAAVCSNLK